MLQKKATAKKLTQKETIASEVSKILSTGLATFKESLGEKKFEKRIRKATKLFSHGVKSIGTKKSAEKKVPLKNPKKKAARIPAKKSK